MSCCNDFCQVNFLPILAYSISVSGRRRDGFAINCTRRLRLGKAHKGANGARSEGWVSGSISYAE